MEHGDCKGPAYPKIFRWNGSPDLTLAFKGQLGSLILAEKTQREEEPQSLQLCVSCPDTVPLKQRVVNMQQHEKDHLIVCRTCRAAKILEEFAEEVLTLPKPKKQKPDTEGEVIG